MVGKTSTPQGRRITPIGACLVFAILLVASGTDGHEGDSAEIHNETDVDDHGEAQTLNITLVGSVQVEAPLDHASRKFFTTTDLYVAENYAYLGSDNNRMHIIDISQPEAMHVVAQVEMPGPALDIKVDNNLAVIAIQGSETSEMGVVVVDIADPRQPVVLAHFFAENWFGVHNLYLYQNRAYLAHSANRGISVLNLTDPTQPFISGSWRNDEPGFGSIIHDVFIRDGLAFLSDKLPALGGLVILDLADPDNPMMLSSLAITGGLHNAWMEANYVYCNQEFGGWTQPLHIIDVSDPRQPTKVGAFTVIPPTSGQVLGPHNTWVEDHLLYWAFNGGGLRVLDISDPIRPLEIGYYTTPSAWGAQPHEDGLIYVADSHLSALMAFRFDEPSYAIRQASLSTSSAFVGKGTQLELRATVTSRKGTAQIHRVGARLIPPADGAEWSLHQDNTGLGGQFTGVVDLPPDVPSGHYHMEVWAEDDEGLIYPYRDVPLALFPSTDLQLLDDILFPGTQVHLERGASGPDFATLGPVYRGTLAGAFHLQTESTLGWEISLDYDRAIDLLGYDTLRLAFHPGDAAGEALILFLDDYRFSLLGRRSSPRLRMDLDHREWQIVEIPLDILLRDRQINTIRFVGDLQGTFYIDDLRLVTKATLGTTTVEAPSSTLPPTIDLEQNFPNPFNGQTVIRFALGQESHVDLAIFNLVGQRVATLIQGRRLGGVHTLHWDGRHDDGKLLTSGVYLYRLKTGQYVKTRKLLMMR